jgi:hypothetical protein
VAFAQSVVSFLNLYDFDGVDIDWEAPLDPDKGGGPDNYERFVLLAEEIRNAFVSAGKDYLLTIALPPTDWELLDYDVEGLSEHVDWFNLMTFDYHTPKNIPKTVGAHSDLKLIDSVVFDLLQETIPTKFVLGMAAYGRTYTLADDRCKELGCPFRSPGLGGCANTPGFLPFHEIHDYIQSQSYDELHQDVSSSSMVAVVDEDQMISFDDESTWAIKEAYAEMMCLRGTMLWSVDMLGKSYQPPGGARRSLSALDDVPPEATKSDGDARSLSSSGPGCDICGGTGRELIESRWTSYAGNESTCGELSQSLQQKRELSFTCSLARTSLVNSCCADLDEADNGGDESQLVQAPPSTSCSICHRNNVHHELKSEAMVEYKGTSISCLDLNSVLAKNEVEGSNICSATQSMLFGGCCYERCSVCGDKTLRFDSTVTYNSQILSCDELDSMFNLGAVWEGSEQCDAMQSAYSSACCYDAPSPEDKCNLCGQGSLEGVNTHAFVKTLSSTVHCVDLATSLAEREEEGSETCANSRLEYAGKCCTSPAPDADASYYEWLTDHMTPSSSNTSRLSVFFWLSMVAILIFI